MPSTERFKPYSRGVTRDEILAYLKDSDERPTCRDKLSKRALQIKAASRQRFLDTTLHTSQPDVAINPYPHPQEATTSADSPDNLLHQEFKQSGINPMLLQAVKYHGQQEPNYTSSTSESSLSDLESSSYSSQPAKQPLSSAQIESLGEEELISLGSYSSPEAFNDLIDFKQLDGFLSQFEGVDVFAPAAVASNPPTPILPNDIPSVTGKVDDDNGNAPDLGQRVQSSNASSKHQLQVIARLDRLISLQQQILFINFLNLEGSPKIIPKISMPF